ncbi:MAG TPA: DUF4227 family protein [Candidatus Angelobacter sp.]|nr:DUF4227 family protein [Candidatus Angelobacter sp.]
MKSTMKLFIDSLRLLILFMGFTVLFFYGLKWLDQHYESYNKYDKPSDGAVKVLGPTASQPATDESHSSGLRLRLFQFFQDGE